jgi:hypothetical protein
MVRVDKGRAGAALEDEENYIECDEKRMEV